MKVAEYEALCVTSLVLPTKTLTSFTYAQTRRSLTKLFDEQEDSVCGNLLDSMFVLGAWSVFTMAAATGKHSYLGCDNDCSDVVGSS